MAAVVASAILAACGTGGYSGAEPPEGDSANQDAGDAAGADSEFFQRNYGEAETDAATPMDKCLASDPSNTAEGIEAGLNMDMEEFCTSLQGSDPESFDSWYGETPADPAADEANLDENYIPELPAVPEPGADAAYVDAVDAESRAAYDAFPGLRDAFTDEDLVKIGNANCAQMDAFTLDEIFMKAYDEMGVTQEEDSMFLLANFVWSTILNAPATLCPKHEDDVKEWKASAH